MNVSREEENLFTQKCVINLLLKPDRFACAKFVPTIGCMLESDLSLQLVRTTGTFFTFWLNIVPNSAPNNVPNEVPEEKGEIGRTRIECEAGTGGYPQIDLYEQEKEKEKDNILVFEASKEKQSEWLDRQRQKEKVRAIVDNGYIRDRTDRLPIETAIEFAKKWNILYDDNTHMFKKIKEGELDSRKAGTLEAAFSLMATLASRLEEDEKYDIDTVRNTLNKLRPESGIARGHYDVEDFTDKYKPGSWMKGQFRIRMVIHDEIPKQIAVVELPPHHVKAVFK